VEITKANKRTGFLRFKARIFRIKHRIFRIWGFTG